MKTRPRGQDLITVDAAAKRLQLHPKTVLRSIRSGRLRATRIGKAYRILRADLDAFAGVPPLATTAAEDAWVTAVVDVPGVGPEVARAWGIKIPAALKGRRSDDPPIRADVVYEPEHSHLKVIVVGSPGDLSKLLGAIRLWLERV